MVFNWRDNLCVPSDRRSVAESCQRLKVNRTGSMIVSLRLENGHIMLVVFSCIGSRFIVSNLDEYQSKSR